MDRPAGIADIATRLSRIGLGRPIRVAIDGGRVAIRGAIAKAQIATVAGCVVLLLVSLFAADASAVTDLERDCGAVPSRDYFRTDPPELRHGVVRVTTPFPRWVRNPSVYVSPALGRTAKAELDPLWVIAGLTPRVVSTAAADIAVRAFSLKARSGTDDVICIRCNPSSHMPQSEFDVLPWTSVLSMRNVELFNSAPDGLGTSERYWPYDQQDFLSLERARNLVGNVYGSVAANRKMELVGAECFINVELAPEVQRSLIRECAARALGFPNPGNSALLKRYSVEERAGGVNVSVDDGAVECVRALYRK